MIFTRIRVGELSTLANEGKTHVSFSLVLFQPLSLRKATGGWGSYDLWEWGGRTVSPCLHADSIHVWLNYGRKNLHALSNSGPHDFAIHLHAWTILCLLASRTSIFLVFPTDAASWELCSFIHDRMWRAIHVFGYLTDWYGCVIFSRQFNVGIGIIFLSMGHGFRCSPQDLLCGCGLPHAMIVVVLLHLGSGASWSHA